MKLGIMQPYVFPYIGYFQLLQSADKFVFLDDVNFINRGWINRNRILVNGKANLFTVPIQNSSQNRLINEIAIADTRWQDGILKTIEMAYKKAPQFEPVFSLIKEVFNFPATNIADLARQSIKSVCLYLEVTTKIIDSSGRYNNKDLKGEDRIIDINEKEGATDYINPIGGTELYQPEKFSAKGIKLYFLQTKEITYPQRNNEFVPHLSIIDVVMYNDKEAVQQYLNEYNLIN